MTTDREDELEAFLGDNKWSVARRVPIASDASTRKYERLYRPEGRAVLMNAPPSAEAPSFPPGASIDERKALGYNATARLAGPDMGSFVALSNLLSGFGLSPPKVLAADLDRGFLLLEDLGDDLFARVLEQGADETELYKAAVDVLLLLHQQKISHALSIPNRPDYVLGTYNDTALIAEAELLTDWFWPLVKGKSPSEDTKRSFLEAWNEVWPSIRADHPVLVLRDYHAENLIWLRAREGTARVGLIDFQDAVLGPRAYDLVSLLEDARRDVPPDLAEDMIEYYCGVMKSVIPSFDGNEFRRSYAALGAQRNAKIIGIFARLCKRDGKPAYLKLLPRVWRHMEHDLEAGHLEKLKDWFDSHIPDEMRHTVPQTDGRAHG